MSDSKTSDETKSKDSLLDMFSQDELDVAEILLDFPKLISFSNNNPMLSSMNNSSKSRNPKRSSSVSQIPPSNPRLKIYEDLQKKHAELITLKETFERELEKVRNYHEQQKAYNLLLKEEAKRHEQKLQPFRAATTTVEEEEDHHLPPKKDKKIIKIKKSCIRTGESRQG